MNERKDCEGKEGSWTAVIPPLLALLGLIVWIGCIGCDRVSAADSTRQLKNGAVTNHEFGAMYTSLHDGHWWIIAARNDSRAGMGLIHHPDCSCGKGGK